MVTETSAWGGPATMTAWEALMWRSEANPRTRSSGVLLELLASEPDWSRLVAAHERVTREIPRLRDRVVEPLLPLVQPVWSPDPHFDLRRHLQTVRTAPPGTRRQLLELCESVIRRPFDRGRPPWEAVLVTGLEGGKAAYLLKMHHSLTDGLGLIQLLELVHSKQATPRNHPPRPAPPDVLGAPSPVGLLARGVRDQLADSPRVFRRGWHAAASGINRWVEDPGTALGDGAGYARSIARQLAPTAARSTLLRGRGGVGTRLATVDAPLSGLRAAAKAAGVSVNDAFLAAVLGGMRAYHEQHGSMVERLPIGIPISLRKDDDPLGGNQFAAARFAAPLAEPDPVARMHEIRNFVLRARGEPAVGFANALSPALTRLPVAVIIEVSAKLTASSDLQVSNIRGIGHQLYLAGVAIDGMYPLGPRPGVAAMITMITYNGRCCVGLNVDPDAFPDLDELERCMSLGFDEVLTSASAVRNQA
jgi:WS/DGAT/MGAT family acyltransferase